MSEVDETVTTDPPAPQLLAADAVKLEVSGTTFTVTETVAVRGDTQPLVSVACA